VSTTVQVTPRHTVDLMLPSVFYEKMLLDWKFRRSICLAAHEG
jgi:hypothetical protein